MNGKQLKNSILQWAIQGKLVPQDPNDEPASVLLEKIRQEKERLIKDKKIKRDKNASIIYRGEDNSYYEKFIATGEVKCIDEEIPFEIPKGWEWERLGNITTIKGGKRIPVGMKLTLKNTGHKYIRVADMKNHSVKCDDIHYITDDIYEIIKAYYISKDDLYITVAGTIGNVGVVPEEFDNANLTENADKIEIYSLCKLYLLYALLSEVVQEQVRECTTKVGQPKLAIVRIQKFLIPIAPLAEQRRISERIDVLLPIVDRYDVLFSKLGKLNNSINEFLKKSILQEAIQGRLVPQITEEGSANELLEQIKEEKKQLVKEGKLKKLALNDSTIFRGDDNKYWEKSTECMESIDDNIPFEIPSTWCWVRHNQLFEISGGSQPPKSQFVDNPKSGYIRLYQIRDYGPNPMPVYIPKEKANKITKEGDIILARYGGSLGKVFWAKDGAYNVAMAKVIPLFESEFVNKQYLFLFYQSSIYQYLVKDHSRSAQAGFNKDDLTDLFFPLPPLEEQSRIVEKYKSVTSIMSK